MCIRDSGAIEIISDHLKNEEELQWIEHMARTTGRPLTTLVTPETGEEIWKLAERLESEGINIRPQAGARLASILMTLEGTVNPMRQFPSYSTIKNLSIEEQKRALRTEKFRSQVLADEPKLARDRDTNKMISSWDRMFVLPEDLSYEPGYEDSLEGRAAREGLSLIHI